MKDYDPQLEANAPNHPLENSWTLHFDKRQKGPKTNEASAYENNLKNLGEFESVNDFWRLYNFIDAPSELELGSNYHLFKSGIKPMWEDSANAKGGQWQINLAGVSPAQVNQIWKNLVLGMIGENLDDTRDEVCGAVFCRRKVDRIQLWNKSSKPEIAMALGKKLREVLLEDVMPRVSFELGYCINDDLKRDRNAPTHTISKD